MWTHFHIWGKDKFIYAAILAARNYVSTTTKQKQKKEKASNMGANATVYEKPPSFHDGPDEWSNYSDFKGPTTDKTQIQEIRYSKK